MGWKPKGWRSFNLFCLFKLSFNSWVSLIRSCITICDVKAIKRDYLARLSKDKNIWAETAMLIADWKDEGIVKEEISFLANSVHVKFCLFPKAAKRTVFNGKISCTALTQGTRLRKNYWWIDKNRAETKSPALSWIRSHDLSITRRALYHCATTTAQERNELKNLEKSSHDIQDCRLPDGGVLGLGRERGVAGHEEVQVRRWDEWSDETNQIVVHVRRIPATAC